MFLLGNFVTTPLLHSSTALQLYLTAAQRAPLLVWFLLYFPKSASYTPHNQSVLAKTHTHNNAESAEARPIAKQHATASRQTSQSLAPLLQLPWFNHGNFRIRQPIPPQPPPSPPTFYPTLRIERTSRYCHRSKAVRPCASSTDTTNTKALS